MIGVILLLGGLIAGGKSSNVQRIVDPGAKPADTRGQVRDLILENFYKPITNKQLEAGSIAGMVKALEDPFSAYFSPKEYKDFTQATSGSFSGVGIVISTNKAGIVIQDIIEGSPADRAPLRAGDIIVAVDGESARGISREQASTSIRGKMGSTVALTLARSNTMVKLQRTKIEQPVVERKIVTRANRRYGHLRLASFTATASEQVERDLKFFISKQVDGLVLDLRGNGGGLLNQAVDISDLFLAKGVVTSVRGLHRNNRVYRAEPGKLEFDEVVVLVDENTASASEILTAALEDNNIATVVGDTTFGKGVVEELLPLENGGALKLTIAEYLTPRGKSLHKRGVTPDILARDRLRTPIDEALQRAFDALD